MTISEAVVVSVFQLFYCSEKNASWNIFLTARSGFFFLTA